MMTAKDFTVIKSLLSAGLSRQKTSEVAERSYATVDWVSKTDSFVDYKKTVADYNATMKAKRGDDKIEQYAHSVGAEVEKKELPIIEIGGFLTVLQSIDNSLKRMADAWETPDTKKTLKKALFGSK